MPLDGTVAMTTAEKEVVINLNPKDVTKFTRANLATYERLRVKEAYPRIFGTQAPPWLKYVESKLINVSDIEFDNKQFEQVARATINPKIVELREDIRTNGFNLAELGVFAVRLKNGKYIIMEGRTRTTLTREHGVTNIIADVFDVKDIDDDLANIVRFAIFMNASKKPFGEASYEDIRKGIIFLVRSGAIAKQENTILGKSILKRDITEELQYLAGGKLKPAQQDTIFFDALKEAQGYPSVKSFPRGKDAQNYLEELLGAERIAKDLEKGIQYVTTASFEGKMFKRMVTVNASAPKSIKEIRFVIHIGVPRASDPERSWISGAADFKKNFNIFEEQIAAIRFNGVNVDNSRIKIWGAIPQVRSLNKKYPMDRVYVYK